MTDPCELRIEAFWDCDYVPSGSQCERGLLLRVHAPEIEQNEENGGSLNLALVIDASGSMRGSRLEAAKQASCRIVECLENKDRLSVVSFSKDSWVPVDGELISQAGKQSIIENISKITSRGSTNLGSGWWRGAEAVANHLDQDHSPSANVIVLSDGKANQGIRDPGRLAHYAGELQARGITTSCVGIGDDYSPLQLNAIAEMGGGRLHESAIPEEICDVLMGELGAVRTTAANSVELELIYPDEAAIEVLTRLPCTNLPGEIKLSLGPVGCGGQRETAFLVELPPGPAGKTFRFQYRVHWVNPNTGEQNVSPMMSTQLTVTDPLQYQEEIENRDVETANKIVLLWQSGLVFEALSLNESRQYHRAMELIDRHIPRMQRFVRGLATGDELLRTVRRLRNKVRNPWKDKRGLRASFVASKKTMKNEIDFRQNQSEDWRGHI